MFTNNRLNEVYHNAPRKYFDTSSKLIFFSDAHRGDDSLSDEFSRNKTLMLCALKYYYQHGYTYIEVGDGDELWEYTHFKYIRTAHADIFTLLKAFFKANRFIMLYGNHNIFLKNKNYVAKNYYYYYDEYGERVCDLFKGIVPLEGIILKHCYTGQEILVVHGHQGDLLNDQLWPINMFFLRYLWRLVHVVGFKNPASPTRNHLKRHKIEKNYSKWIKAHHTMLICGHSHRSKFPRPHELPYFNTGCCIHSKGICGIEILNDQIMIVQWRILPDDNGSLKAVRQIICGPRPLSQFKF